MGKTNFLNNFMGVPLLRGLGYKVNPRNKRELMELAGKYWQELFNGGRLAGDLNDVAYVGAEHKPKPKQLASKFPNITYFENLPYNLGGMIYASSLGHTHPPNDFGVQEIYEFLDYGGMLICSEKENKMILCSPGEKLVVPSDCDMTIFNLSKEPLTTLDMAHPYRNPSSKQKLKEKGPMMVFYQNESNGKVRVRLNHDYECFRLYKDFDEEIKINSPWIKEGLFNALSRMTNIENIQLVNAFREFPHLNPIGFESKKSLLDMCMDKDEKIYKSLELTKQDLEEFVSNYFVFERCSHCGEELSIPYGLHEKVEYFEKQKKGGLDNPDSPFNKSYDGFCLGLRAYFCNGNCRELYTQD